MIRTIYRRVLPLSFRKTLYRLRHPRAASKDVIRSLHKITPAVNAALNAKEHLDRWNLGAALEEARRATDLDPTILKAYLLQIQVLASMGLTDEARSLASSLQGQFPMNVALVRQSQAVGLHPPPLSIDEILSLVTTSDASSSSAAQAMEYLYFYEKFEEALSLFDLGMVAVSKLRTEKRRIAHRGALLWWRAMCLEMLDRFDEAVRVYADLLNDPKYASRAASSIARCKFEAGHSAHAEAIFCLNSKTQDLPFSPLYMDILQGQDRIDIAYQLYRKRPISTAISSFFGKPESSFDIDITDCKDKAAIILSEGGPGDEFRLSSVYPLLKQQIGKLTITCDPRLTSIMRRSFPDIEFLPVARHRREFAKPMSDRTLLSDARLFQCVSDDVIIKARDSDMVCSVLDTLVDVRPTRSSFRESERPILKPDTELAHLWRQRMGQGVKIGVSWRSMLHSVARSRHYFKAEDLAPLARVEGAELWLLQPGATEEEIDTLRGMLNLKVPDGIDLTNDLEGQMAMIANLDYVISPFTTTGEMAGAVGTRTFMISMTRNTRWRRELDGSDLFSPSTTILFREGDVQSAIEQAADLIQKEIGATG